MTFQVTEEPANLSIVCWFSNSTYAPVPMATLVRIDEQLSDPQRRWWSANYEDVPASDASSWQEITERFAVFDGPYLLMPVAAGKAV